jgi:tripartite-type tricarboxylate transporter receptor subunit TctC
MKRLVCVSVLLVAKVTALLLPFVAAAQTYPSRPVRVIASSAAGGLSDVFMRVLGDELQKRWGQPVIIENRPGGNFNIGTRACAESAPDGYTFCLISNEAVTYNLFLYRNLPFDLENGIMPVTNLFFITQTLAVNADTRVKTVAELVAYARERPKTLSYSAPAAPLILFFDNLNREHGIDLVRVPFKGGGDAINGVLSGITPIVFLGIGNMLSHLQSGKMNAVLVDSEKRSSLVPNVPTITELGYRGPVTRSYFAFYAPSGTPKDLAIRFADDVRAIASDPAFREKNFIQRGVEPVLNTPDQFAVYLKQDRINAKRVVDDSGMKPH